MHCKYHLFAVIRQHGDSKPLSCRIGPGAAALRMAASELSLKGRGEHVNTKNAMKKMHGFCCTCSM